MKKDIGKFEASLGQFQKESKMMDSQITQMGQHISSSQRPSTQFPTQTVQNDKGPNQMNAITTRSGKVLKPPPPHAKIVDKSKGKEKVVEVEIEGPIEDIDASPTNVPTYVPPTPFPQRLAKARIEKRYRKILQMVKDVQF